MADAPATGVDSGRDIAVTVITVVRNGAAYLERAIESVLSQTHPRIEYMVLDGGSTDDSPGIIRRYESRLAYWHSRPDGGIYDAMNDGIRRARGDLIGLLNSDDWYEPDAVQVGAAAYARAGRDLVHGRIALHAPDGTAVGSAGGRNAPVLRLFTTPFKHPALFVTRSLYERVGFYDTRYRLAADYDFMLRAIRAGTRDTYLPRILTHVGLTGLTTATRQISAPDELVQILERHIGSRVAARAVMAVRRARRRLSSGAPRAY